MFWLEFKASYMYKCILMFLYRFTENSNLEVTLFILHAQMRANNQQWYVPDEEKTVAHVNDDGAR